MTPEGQSLATLLRPIRVASWSVLRSSVAGPVTRRLSHAIAKSPVWSPLHLLIPLRSLLKGEVTSARLLVIADALDGAGINWWLAGGWGVDALAGRQTRRHDDVDIVVEDFEVDAPRAVAALGSLGFIVIERHRQPAWMPDQLELEDSHSSRVDVVSIDWERLRTRAPALAEGGVFSHGQVAGRSVPCLSYATQRLFHSGFAPRHVEPHDLALLG